MIYMLDSTERKRKGFTLIEMLIVVAIIGILASVVLVGLGPVQRRGRDARRLADLREVQNALELYFSKCGYYPGNAQSSTPCGAFSSINGPQAWANLQTALSGSNVGVRNIPNDPSGGRTYFYGTDSSGSTYVLGADLEDAENPALAQDVDVPLYGVACDGATVYCIEF